MIPQGLLQILQAHKDCSNLVFPSHLHDVTLTEQFFEIQILWGQRKGIVMIMNLGPHCRDCVVLSSEYPLTQLEIHITRAVTDTASDKYDV